MHPYVHGIRTRSQAPQYPAVDEEEFREIAQAIMPAREFSHLRSHNSPPQKTGHQTTPTPPVTTSGSGSTSAPRSPAPGKPAKSPASGKAARSPASEKPAKSPASEKSAHSPTSENSTNSHNTRARASVEREEEEQNSDELQRGVDQGWKNWEAEMDRGSLTWDPEKIRKKALAKREQTERNIEAAKAAGTYRDYVDYSFKPEKGSKQAKGRPPTAAPMTAAGMVPRGLESTLGSKWDIEPEGGLGHLQRPSSSSSTE
jgi:hypothetical protein